MMTDEQQQKLERIFIALIERYGSKASLGEVYAANIALHRLRNGHALSVSELAMVADQPISNIWRWLGRVPHIELFPDPNDDRRRLIRITDWEAATRHLPRLAEVLANDEG